MYRDIDLITSAERVSLQVKGQAKVGLCERQISLTGCGYAMPDFH